MTRATKIASGWKVMSQAWSLETRRPLPNYANRPLAEGRWYCVDSVVQKEIVR